MKKWENPELKNLELAQTNTEENECVGEGKKNENDKSLLPDHIVFCTRWDNELRCTHPNWKPGRPFAWPCPQAPVQGGGSN